VGEDECFGKGRLLEEHGIWRIPKPFELGVLFGSVPERIVEYAMRKDPKVFEGMAGTLAGGAAPSAIPTAALPLLEVWANKSVFTGRPLVSKAQEGILPEHQGREYTTEAAKQAGKAVAAVPGMPSRNLHPP
jgi:hypothetical protein